MKVIYRKTGEVEAVLNVADERLQEVLDRAWKTFGDPLGKQFPGAFKVSADARLFGKRKKK